MTAKLFATAHEVAEALGVKDTKNCLGLTLRVRAQEIPTLTVHQFAPDSSQLKTISERFTLLPINEVPDKRLAATQQQAERAALTISGHQLREALEFLAPDGTAEQLEQEVCIQHGPERTHDEGTDPVGLYCWLSEYPDEGSIPLLGEAGEQPAASKPDYRHVTPIRQPGEPS